MRRAELRWSWEPRLTEELKRENGYGRDGSSNILAQSGTTVSLHFKSRKVFWGALFLSQAISKLDAKK